MKDKDKCDKNDPEKPLCVVVIGGSKCTTV
jgi:hypothetical protein